MSLVVLLSNLLTYLHGGEAGHHSQDRLALMRISRLTIANVTLKANRKASIPLNISSDYNCNSVIYEVILQLENQSQIDDRVVYVRSITLHHAVTRQIYLTCPNPVILRLRPLENVVKTFYLRQVDHSVSQSLLKATIQYETEGLAGTVTSA